MASPGHSLALVVGTPRGFTRSVLESLLKRGSRVLLSCSDATVGQLEQDRLSSLYGKNKVHFSPGDHTCPLVLESVFVKALDTFGEINLIVNSTANDAQKLKRCDGIPEQITTNFLRDLEKRLDIQQQREDVEGIRRMGKLAIKYMGKQSGFQGGSLLNLTSAAELTCTAGAGTCTVLGTTRAFGLEAHVKQHGVRTTTVYQPTIDYPDLSQAAQITDDSHSPHNKWDRYSAYIRDYTGYMALHVGDTSPPGTAWTFNRETSKLEEVLPESLASSCGVTNKMCFWMGCCMLKDEGVGEVVARTPGRREEVQETQEQID